MIVSHTNLYQDKLKKDVLWQLPVVSTFLHKAEVGTEDSPHTDKVEVLFARTGISACFENAFVDRIVHQNSLHNLVMY